MRTLPVALAVVFVSCVHVDMDAPVRSYNQTVDRKNAETVRAEIRMAAGQLRVRGGAPGLLDAEFRTRMSPPRVRYDVTGTMGRLVVETEGRSQRLGNHDDNRWELALANDVAMDLDIKLGAGESWLDVSSLALRTLQVHMGAGDLTLDLRGDYKKDVDVQVHGGVGRCRLYLPRSTGAMVDAKGGLGHISARGLSKQGDRWVNERYNESLHQLRAVVRGGVGQIELIGRE